jgi:BirA family biotin operon repressor/biotin-[acetyl-CoA-carboxylase] ligase
MLPLLLSDNAKKLLTLLADGEFHSGTRLAEILGISRAAVCKHINQLAEQLDLNIAAISGKGYRLDKALSLLEQEKIAVVLTAQLGRLEIHDQITSTNQHLMATVRGANVVYPVVCLAEQQTAGKGRRGREWVSPFGHNVYLSIAWQFLQGGYTAIAGLSLAIGVAVIRALHEMGIHEVGLKWPNDIVHQGKKLGGILIEVSGETDGVCNVVIGVGLNVFLSASKAQNITQAWTDITTISDNTPDRNLLVAVLLNQICAVLADFESQGIQAYLNEWRTYDCLQGLPASVLIAQHSIEGIVQGVDDNGLLLLKRHDGVIQTFASGEVSLRRIEQ